MSAPAGAAISSASSTHVANATARARLRAGAERRAAGGDSKRAIVNTDTSSAVRRRCLSPLDGLLHEPPVGPRLGLRRCVHGGRRALAMPAFVRCLLRAPCARVNQAKARAHCPMTEAPTRRPNPTRAARRASGSSPARARGAWRRLRLRLRGRRGAWAAGAVAIVLAGTLASALGAHAIARSGADNARLAFHLSSTEVASTLTLAIQHEEDLIVSAGAFVSANPHASPAAFDRWAKSVHAMQRYPELRNFGFVELVPASQLAELHDAPVLNAGAPVRAKRAAPAEPLQILPPGNRPYYCLAVAGLARNAASYIPAGMDYCAIAPTLINARETGLSQLRAGPQGRDGLARNPDADLPRRLDPSTPAARRARVRGMARRAGRPRRRARARAGRSPQPRRALPLRDGPVARGVLQRQDPDAAPRAPKSGSATAGRCRASPPASPAASSATRTR